MPFVRSGSRVANTTYACETPAPVMNRFVPFSTRRRRRARTASSSPPGRSGSGLGERVGHQDLAADDAADHALGLLVVAGEHERDHAELGDGRGEREPRRTRVSSSTRTPNASAPPPEPPYVSG